ncbi:serine hydrolase [Amycolatopsis sp. NPDC051106]|uniref:serine hydrolase domain-containing protein n=1 Tax=unclassified Amycolatopsis TaxID=2618356 RepID=UPI00342CE262
MNRVRALARRFGMHAVRVSRAGEPILACGDQARPVVVHSIRKSFAGALFGQILERGLVALDTTLAELDIDDTPTLTAVERSATVQDLLQARSGVYLPPAVEPPPGAAHLLPPRPVRGAHPPGTHWCYNNWDFNVLGNIYERVTHTSVFLGLDRELARPLGMTDWDPYRHGRYEYRADPLGGTTRYPNYQLAFSARDLDRFGTLYLRDGRRAGVQVVPAGWAAASTQPVSPTPAEPDHSHHGHLWWVSDGSGALPRGSFSALGMGGSFVTVIPGHDLVLVGLFDTHAGGFRPLGAGDRSALYRTLIEEATLV